MKADKQNCPALIIMSRWPATNRCKSRLSAEIGSIKASLIQKKLINHTLEVAKVIEKKNLVEIHLAISGIYKNAAKRWSKEIGLTHINNQGEGTLGLRMRRAILKLKSHKLKRDIIIIGTDLPTLCERNLVEALEALKYHQLVIGPSKDGGYWLIGLSQKLLDPLAIWPFINISWGSKEVLKETIRFAKLTNTNYFLLEEQNDLDLEDDLSPWIR